VDGAVRGMIEFGLEDPYSGYLPPDQYGSALDDLSGEFSGIGAEVGMENLIEADDLAACTVVTQNCAMVIVAPLAGSPAEEAGLRAGDLVLEIDGRMVEMDARPSDAIALAVRSATPIYATDEVLERAGVTPEADEDEKLSVFREFINSLDIDLEAGAGEGPSEPPREPGSGERRLD